MKNTKLELDLFDGEAAAADNAATAETADAQPYEPQGSPSINAREDKHEEFERLIKGEFKEAFDKRIKDNINRRFKESSEKKAADSQKSEIIDMLKLRYQLPDGSMEDILNALRDDGDHMLTEKSEDKEKSDMEKRLRELEEENQRILSEVENGIRDRQMRSTIDSWLKDSKELESDFPDFSLETEAKNPLFQKLLRSGLDLKTAYFATHHEEIVNSKVQKASEDVGLKITDSIRAKGLRPAENGAISKSTAILKRDVSKLTPKERADIAQRVMSGEEISF